MTVSAAARPNPTPSLALAHVSQNAHSVVCALQDAQSSEQWDASASAIGATIPAPVHLPSALDHTPALSHVFRSERADPALTPARVPLRCAVTFLRPLPLTLILRHQPLYPARAA